MHRTVLLALCLGAAHAYRAAPHAPRRTIGHSVASPAAAPAAAAPRPRPAQITMAVAELTPPTTNAASRFLTSTWFVCSSIVSVFGLYPAILAMWAYSMAFDDARRRLCDWVVQLWAKVTLLLMGSKVTIEGAENLPPPGEAVMYCPNHCSFLDIFSLSGFLPRRFKYISKIEILRIPFIGWAMGFAKHIAIRRTDRASQLATFKEAVATLQAGNSLVTFPEGTRSKDGRLMDFKKGPFTMAASAGVRVVPVSIVGTHLFQPPSSVLPMAPPRGVRIVVHPPLDAPAKKKEGETMEATKAAVLSALPLSMQPLVPDTAPRA